MVENEQFPMIAKTLAELEDVLAEELIGLGADNVVIGTRMVSFTGDNALMYKANLHCRTALRILKPIYEFKAETADEVYEAIKQLNWENYLSLNSTFSIDAVVFSHIFNHSKFVAYRVKDAIADWFMERYEKRPSVSLTNPDVMLNIHVSHNKCTLSLDSSGESLHKRGYRIAQTEAPLSEVLAAGMILKSGWRGESAFIDPMCGSGTILIEAAMIALGIPPGIHRPSFAFEKWSDFDKDPEETKKHFPTIYQKCLSYGIDITKDMIPVAPAAHYLCGGISVNLDGETSIGRLYANGECACTGLHGANRLASNSLIEAVVYADAAAKHSVPLIKNYTFQEDIPPWNAEGTTSPEEMVLITQSYKEVGQIMSSYVGIVRSDIRLNRAMDRLNILFRETENLFQRSIVSRDICELRNIIKVGYLVIKQAMARKESRGLHFTVDYPDRDPNSVL
jgi:23S rRNA G2445 N2-methylase RlmL